jgi:hypothetical protein
MRRDARLAESIMGMLQYAVYAICSVGCTWCILYSVYTVLGVCCTHGMLYLVLTLDHGMERWRGMTELCVLR